MRLIINLRRLAFGVGCLLSVLALIAAGCGNDDTDDTADLPTVIATTSIWGDVVANVACDGLADVGTLIPPGGDPHAFQPSLNDRGNMESAALIVANGLFLEEGLEDTIDAVEEAGTPVFRVADHVSTIEFASTMGHGHDEHDEDDHDDEHDEHEHDHDEDDHDDHEDEHDERTTTRTSTTSTTSTTRTTTTTTRTSTRTTTRTRTTTTTTRTSTTRTRGPRRARDHEDHDETTRGRARRPRGRPRPRPRAHRR